MCIGLAQGLLLLAIKRQRLFKMIEGLLRFAAAVQGQSQRELCIGLSWLVVTLLEARQGSLAVFSGLLPRLLPDERLCHSQHGLPIAPGAVQLLELASSRQESIGGSVQFAQRQARLRGSQQAFGCQ